MARDTLTPKQAKFVIEYLIDLNGTQAAIRAGYSEDTATEIASENLTKPNIKSAIQEQMDARASRTLITADWVLERMKEVAERCLQAKPVMYFDKVDKAMKQEMEFHTKENGELEEVGVYQFDSAGANKALENLARNQKLLTDKVDMGNADGTNFTFPVMTTIFVKSPDEIKNAE